NMTAGLMKPTSGSVYYRGERITKVNHDTGYLTQHNNLLPWRTEEKNVRVALEIRHLGRREATARARDALEAVGLGRHLKAYPSQLSGGMQKRVALARTLVYNRRILRGDEPFGSLDAQLRLRMQRELLEIWEHH